MGEAFGWGAIGASALLLGAVIAYQFPPSRQVIAVVMALGAGLLIGSVSFELIDEALKTQTVAWVALLVLVGAGAFTVGNWLLERHGGAKRKDPSGAQAEGSPMAIVLGSVLDGIPESFVLGRTVLQGGGEPVAARRGRALQPAGGHGVLHRVEGGEMAEEPGHADVTGRRPRLRPVRSRRLPAAGPGQRPHRCAGPVNVVPAGILTGAAAQVARPRATSWRPGR
jgi:hypothetical protein